MKIGLVLEGGGMRGLYTVGVLDALIDLKIDVDYVVGVSAGACNGVSYVSGQRGRNFRINIDYIGDKRYLSVRNLISTKSMFGMDFIFNSIPHELVPFNYDAFHNSKMEFVTGVTDVNTGKPKYFDKSYIRKDSDVIKASSSIPMFSPMVNIEGGEYLDGGTSDPIPVRRALKDGCDKVIVVLTRERGYVKPPESFKKIYTFSFKKYPQMVKLLDHRHEIYNSSLRLVEKLEKEGKAIVIAPSTKVELSRFEKDKSKLTAAYNKGIKDTKKLKFSIEKLIKKG